MKTKIVCAARKKGDLLLRNIARALRMCKAHSLFY